MRLLAVESATATLSVALHDTQRVVCERFSADAGHHAEHVLPLIDELLISAGCKIADVTAFAVSIGPGSFTSLRVGLATVKGLTVGTQLPVVAVPTLEVLAFGAQDATDTRALVPLLDARRDEMYAAIFESGDRRRVLEDGLFSAEELAPHLPEKCRLVGEGASIFGARLRELAGAGVDMQSAGPEHPSAGSVAKLALLRLQRNEVAGSDLAPRYVRRAEAEATRLASAVEDPGSL